MKTLWLKIPHSVDISEAEAKMILAARLYEKGELSLGKAAEFAGLTKRNFMESLGQYDVSVFNYPPEDIEQDVANAKAHNS